MKKQIWMLAALTLAAATHAETAVTKRAVPLQAAAQSDAATLATLEQDTRVEVLARKGAWNQVKAPPGQTGWVRMMSLQYETAPGTAKTESEAANPLGGLTSLLTSGRTENSATVTTGVRGLTEEDLENAEANQKELEKMKKYGIGKEAGQSFAKRSKLAPVAMDYLEAPKPAPAAEPEFQPSGG